MKKSLAQKKCEKSQNAKKTREVLRWLPLIPMGLLAFLAKFAYTGCGFTALVLCALMGILIFYNTARLLRARFPKPVKAVKTVFTVIVCIGLLVVGITEALIIKASFGSPGETCDYVVVLGAKVRHDGPSVSLQNRIEGAFEYLTAHPDVIAIVSGGKGGDEPVTEAACMYRELVARGIDPGRIWMEDKATSTWENLKFSLDLIEERTGIRPARIGLISSEYHLFRAGLFAKEQGVEALGIPAKTTIISQKINHFMREVAGVWHYLILGGNYSD